MTAPLTCRNLTVAAGGRDLVHGLTMTLAAGEIVCVLGVNGAGKTCTLETLCGLRPHEAGNIEVNGRALARLDRRTLARSMGLMPQKIEDSFATPTLGLVAMGRHAHKPFWTWQDDDDLKHARRALRDVELAEFAERTTDTLSGGERQRLSLAMLLVQDPAILLLDEPVSQLDPYHQRRVCSVLLRLRDNGRALMVSVHDANVAAHLADRVLFLHGDGAWQLGERDELLRDDALTALYHTTVRQYTSGNSRYFSNF